MRAVVRSIAHSQYVFASEIGRPCRYICESFPRRLGMSSLSFLTVPTLCAFRMHAFLLAACSLLVGAGHTQSVLSSTQNGSSYEIGGSFVITRKEELLEVTQAGEVIWSTVPGRPFLSASAGNDSVVGSNGAFNITQIDIDPCQDQDISSIKQVPWDGTVTGTAVQVSGHLRDCGAADAQYALNLWVPSDLPDRVAFYIDISPSSNEAKPLKKLYFHFASTADEDFFGLGGQASFASLKNQSIPVFTREQGVGRGDEPLTSIENANGSIAGGNHFTGYTAIASYISTDASLFYLSEKSTGYANFDFTDPNAVTVRYDSLSVDGAFTRTSSLFDAIEALTAYTGRMPALPNWVDNGAILGIQGGQDKVNRIVEQGLEPSINTPIAGVWLQDWCGTHSQVREG